jgi:hypothetical protein
MVGDLNFLERLCGAQRCLSSEKIVRLRASSLGQLENLVNFRKILCSRDFFVSFCVKAKRKEQFYDTGHTGQI